MKQIYLLLLFLVVNVARGQQTIAKNQIRWIYRKDTIIYTFDRDIVGKKRMLNSNLKMIVTVSKPVQLAIFMMILGY